METIPQGVGATVLAYGLRVVAALLILFIGRWGARVLRNILLRLMERRGLEPTVVTFAASLTYYALLTFVILAALGQLGIQTTSFIAVLGAIAFAVGLALQGSLSNFAAGVLILLFRPFKVDDVIEGAGVVGKVERIQVFTTEMKTADNKTIIIPNAKLTADLITNFSTKGTRRVDMVFGIGYGDEIDKAKSVIERILSKDKRILKDPPPAVVVLELADSSVNFAVRPWVESSDYWDVRFDVTEAIKKSFDDEGISIPFPQRDVHLYEHKV